MYKVIITFDNGKKFQKVFAAPNYEAAEAEAECFVPQGSTFEVVAL